MLDQSAFLLVFAGPLYYSPFTKFSAYYAFQFHWLSLSWPFAACSFLPLWRLIIAAISISLRVEADADRTSTPPSSVFQEQ